MDNLSEIIKRYSEFYKGRTYTEIADLILQTELNIKSTVSHRTLRRKISEYVNSKSECTGDLYTCTRECEGSTKCAADEVLNNPVIWNKENTIDYFKNIDSISMYQESNKRLQPYLNGDKNNVLVIGDTHEPFTRQGYLEHCREVQERFNCGTVIHIGDEVDNHALSYHESSAEADSVAGEFSKAMSRMKEWYRVFPEVTVIVGNHSSLPFRKANTAGLTKRFLKAYEDIWEAPKGWSWKVNHEYLGVYYTHNASTKPLTMAVNRRQSVVAGHHHTSASIEWNVSKKDKIFGMLTGCGIDDSSYAFAYAKDNAKKSIISCAVVLNGEIPIILPMNL